MAKRWLRAVACLGLLACSSPEPLPSDLPAPGSSPSAPESAGKNRSASRSAPLRGVKLRTVADGLSEPIGVTHAGDGSGRLFVIQQGGAIRIIRRGRLLQRPFLDIASRIASGGERGLLGLAFHPRFEDNRRFYVNYTNNAGDTVIAEYRRSRRRANRAAAGSERILLTYQQPFANHNGGHIAFGPDGYLYIASGDGGGAGDPQGNGQRLDTLLGKILRIDVDNRSGSRGYGIPPDNPFRGRQGARPEIWSYGLRNPWRFSFDRRTGAMWIGDVGQNQWEEIDFEAAGSPGGINWGWNVKEGTRCFATQTDCSVAEASGDFTDPVAEYSHDHGCSVTGGHVYRGKRYESMRGFYFFADYCSGNIWTLRSRAEGPQNEVLRLRSGRGISSFGENEAGELFVADRSGALLRLIATG